MGSIRETLDAAYDISANAFIGNTEFTNYSSLVGFTSRIIQYYTETYNSSAFTSYFYYSIFIDPADNQPYQDAVFITNNNQAVYNPASAYDRGLRHYYNQMEAMEGYTVGAPGGLGQGNGIGPVSSEIDASYKSTNISMGEMRSFSYPRAANDIWPSTSAPDGLENTGNGAISVGDTA
tara:strand:+ start:840 stop:1373 length:534 start_codon:yes stop_codon:yes gene_type:complete